MTGGPVKQAEGAGRRREALRPRGRSATGWGRDAVTVPRSWQVDFEISAELYGEFRGVLSDEAIRGFVREAMMDLRGSIDREALPEMAMQLARARLAALVRSRGARGSAVRQRLREGTAGRQSGPCCALPVGRS